MGVEVEMIYYVCDTCGILVGMPQDFAEARVHSELCCPNGHLITGNGQRDLRKRAKEFAELASDRLLALQAKDRENAALRGVITKLKKATP